MIDRHPTPGAWLDDIMLRHEDWSIVIDPVTHDEVPYRTSSVLGPDGEYLRIPVARRRIGFDLFWGKSE